jgi:hypothetical protein
LSAVPNTRARLSHALTIRARGKIIGAIHQWAPSMTRDVEQEYEIDRSAVGLPVDLVPQTLSRREIRIARYDTYPTLMEEVFGTSELVTLCDQFRPFTCREVWIGPGINALLGGAGPGAAALSGAGQFAGQLGLSVVQKAANSAAGSISDAVTAAMTSSVGAPIISALGILTADRRVYEYQYCYFTDIGRQIDAKADRVVSVDATIMWLGRRRVQ